MNPALKYKNFVMRTVVYPLNDKHFDPNKDRNLRFFTKYNPHVFGRVLERGLPKEDFESTFRLLLETKYDYLMDIFEKDKEKMNSKDSVAIFVKNGGVSICFIVFDDADQGFYSMMPLTVLGEYEYKKCNYEITLV